MSSPGQSSSLPPSLRRAQVSPLSLITSWSPTLTKPNLHQGSAENSKHKNPVFDKYILTLFQFQVHFISDNPRHALYSIIYFSHVLSSGVSASSARPGTGAWLQECKGKYITDGKYALWEENGWKTGIFCRLSADRVLKRAIFEFFPPLFAEKAHFSDSHHLEWMCTMSPRQYRVWLVQGGRERNNEHGCQSAAITQSRRTADRRTHELTVATL